MLQILTDNLKLVFDNMKMNIIKISLALLFGILSSNFAYAQETVDENIAQPMELPEYIIVRDAILNIKSGTKRFPEKIGPMSVAQLDSLNSLQKQQPILLPPEALPYKIMQEKRRTGFIKGSAGLFSIINAQGEYRRDFGHFDAYGRAFIKNTGEFVDNANAVDYGILLSSDYLADKKYWIMGGSRTRTTVNFRNRDYKLYSVSDAPERSLINFDVAVSTEGNYSGFAFCTGADLGFFKMSQNSANANDNNLSGYLKIKKVSDKYELGGNVAVDFHNVRGNGSHFLQANAFSSFLYGKFTFNINAGIQGAGNSDGTERGGLLLSVDADYRLSELFTISGGALTGLNKNSFRQAAEMNPYVNNNSLVDFEYKMPMIKANLLYHPNVRYRMSLGTRFSATERTPVFLPNATDPDGTFVIDYVQMNKIEIITEAFASISDKDKLFGNFTYTYSNMSNNDKQAPNMSALTAAADYKRQWTEEFGTQIGAIYIGERYADLDNSTSLDGFVNLSVSANYQIINDIKVYIDFDNLTNSGIFIWNGYKEKGLFMSLGVLWQF